MRIALFGKSGTGKTTVAKHLVKAHGFTRHSTGDVCRLVTRLLYGTESRSKMNELTMILRDYDPLIWVRAALRAAPPELVVFDSMRFQTDVEYLTSKGFHTLKITAPTQTRRTRMAERGQQFDVLTDEQHRVELELVEFSADFTIHNPGSRLQRLYDGVEGALVYFFGLHS